MRRMPFVVFEAVRLSGERVAVAAGFEAGNAVAWRNAYDNNLHPKRYLSERTNALPFGQSCADNAVYHGQARAKQRVSGWPTERARQIHHKEHDEPRRRTKSLSFFVSFVPLVVKVEL